MTADVLKPAHTGLMGEGNGSLYSGKVSATIGTSQSQVKRKSPSPLPGTVQFHQEAVVGWQELRATPLQVPRVGAAGAQGLVQWYGAGFAAALSTVLPTQGTSAPSSGKHSEPSGSASEKSAALAWPLFSLPLHQSLIQRGKGLSCSPISPALSSALRCGCPARSYHQGVLEVFWEGGCFPYPLLFSAVDIASSGTLSTWLASPCVNWGMSQASTVWLLHLWTPGLVTERVQLS